MSNVKLVVVGEHGVGKTCDCISYRTDSFPSSTTATVFDNYTYQATIDGASVNVAMWDTAGLEAYDGLRPLSYPDTKVFVIVFSVVDPPSFNNIQSKWVPEIGQHCPGVPFLLVGNKVDLRDDAKTEVITKAQGEALATKIGAVKYVECSALTKQGLKEAFDDAVRAAINPPSTTPAVGASTPSGKEDSDKALLALRRSVARFMPNNFKDSLLQVGRLIIDRNAHSDDDPLASVCGADATTKFRLGVSVGDFEQATSGVTITYKEAVPEPGKDVVVAFSFVVKDDVDPFSLGELSGSIKQMLSLAKSADFVYELKSNLEKDADGKSIYTLTVIYKDDEVFDQCKRVFKFYNIKSAKVTVELNQSPSQQSAEYLQSRIKLEGEITRAAFKVFQNLALPRVSPRSERILSLLRATRNVVFETEFDNLQEFINSLLPVPAELQQISLANFKPMIAPRLGAVLLNESLPEPVRQTYENLSLLSALHSAQVTVGKHSLHASVINGDIFAFLPSLDELRAAAGQK